MRSRFSLIRASKIAILVVVWGSVPLHPVDMALHSTFARSTTDSGSSTCDKVWFIFILYVIALTGESIAQNVVACPELLL